MAPGDAGPDGSKPVTLATRPSIPSARYRERLGRAVTATADAGFDALLVGVGPDLRYLTGYEAMPLERLTMLVMVPGDDPIRLVVPRLEEPAARAGCRTEIPIVTWDEADSPHALVASIVHDRAGAGALRLGVSDRLWASHLLQLQHALPGAGFESATGALRFLRMTKDSDEVALLRLAAQAADRVVEQIAAGRLVGRTEADVAHEVRERLIAEGHEEAHFAIVGSGPNSASPHHDASDRVIKAGEPIVLDIGGTLGGYGSDITRTLWVTGGDASNGPDEEFRHLFGVLRAAQDRATRAVRPGVACEAIDAAARDLIDAEGYGEAFFHRTGHGIGLEGHEDPYLIAGNSEALGEGMAFSVEPGIYLGGRYGARIEDIVVCGPDGPIVLNEASRDLYIVEG
jgi:Xaa-Pro aminopeptidase